MGCAGFDRPVRRDEGLAGDLPPEDPLAAFVGALAPEDVALDRFEVEQFVARLGLDLPS